MRHVPDTQLYEAMHNTTFWYALVPLIAKRGHFLQDERQLTAR